MHYFSGKGCSEFLESMHYCIGILTHYMKMLQDLIAELGIHVKIKNPFQFKTKGEMILECKDREFLQEILDKTMSCSHPDVGRHQGMKTTIAMTNLPQLFEKYKRQYVGNKYFQLALGFHPELVHQYSNQQVLFKELINETRFIGEIGLDYTKKSKEDVMCQTEIFEKIIEWCSGKNKILSVHSRSASKKVVDILNGFDGTVILHWYSGGITDLRRAIEQGCYFSINHQMLQSVNGRNIVGNIPVDRILLESDAPFTKGLSEKYTIDFNDMWSYVKI